MIFAFVGQSQRGKTTAARMLGEILDPVDPIDIHEMSTPLKVLCYDLFGLRDADLNTPEGKEGKHPEFGLTPREIMQRMGDLMRNHFKDYFPQADPDKPVWWVPGHMIYSGLRFRDECQYIVNQPHSILIYVDGPNRGCGEDTQHASDVGVPSLKPLCNEVIVNDGTPNDLMDKLYAIVQKYSAV